MGVCPEGTVLLISETRIVPSNEGPTKRLLIVGPAEWAGGWASDKEHIVVYLGAVQDAAANAEIARRAKVHCATIVE